MFRFRLAAGALAALLAGAGCASAPSPGATPLPEPRPDPSAPAPDPSGGPTGSVPGEPAELERLIDGDSMELRIGGEVVEVRLLGINAPELRLVNGDASCNGREAKAAMEAVLAAGNLRFDGGETDQFGRLLGHLYVGRRAVDGAMVSQGWALALWSGGDPALVAAMEDAAAAGAGLWGPTCGEPAAAVEVGDVQPDPKGRDEEHLNDEWIEIVNRAGAPLDLTGWSVADETTSNRFELPAQSLAPGATLRIHTGSGADTATDVYLDQRDPVWSNSGETVLVADPAGVVVAHRFLPG
ncbi:MAG: lamin tail domain-containing protein [Acidimicrobiales bacterium]